MAFDGYRNEVQQTLLESKCNNLERYLNDLYQNEVKFNVDKEDLDFIQHGIELFVSEIVTVVKSRCSDALEREITKFLKCHGKLKKASTEEEVIGAGSFYEGTKNNYPDEFDFLFIIATFDINDSHLKYSFHDYGYSADLESINYAIKCSIPRVVRVLKHGPDEEGRHLYFVGYVGKHGPASTIKFLYSTGSGTEKDIHVDLVPAFKIVGINQQEIKTERFCRLRQFAEHVESTGSVLVVRNISLTESEISFMKNILSRKHKQIYQVLKYLIGGHGEGELMRKKKPGKGYSSYMIKVSVMVHHYQCASSAEPELGPCLLAVLDSLIRLKESGGSYPTITMHSVIENKVGTSEKIVKDLSKELQEIQSSRKKYDYLRVRRKPVGAKWMKRHRRHTCFCNFMLKCMHPVGTVMMGLFAFAFFCYNIVVAVLEFLSLEVDVNSTLSENSTTPKVLSNGSLANYSL